MRLHTGEQTSRSIIRQEAFRAFADRGASVTIREIAAAAGVSAALVIRHYGSKERLQSSLDDDVIETISAMLDGVVAATAELATPVADHPEHVPVTMGRSLAELLPADSPLGGYLSRMLLDGGERGNALFGRLFEASERTLAALVDAGVAVPGANARVRAMVLLVADLSTIMLRSRISTVLGIDPLSPRGLEIWSREVLAIHQGGLAHG